MIYEDDLYEGNPETWSQTLWKVDIAIGDGLSGPQAQDISDALEDLALAVSSRNNDSADGDSWSVALTTLGEPDTDLIAARLEAMGFSKEVTQISSAPVENKDWLRHVYENFPPVTIGKFFVFGSHFEGEKPAGLVPLQIDAATAFGSGEHETTRGCLLALQKLALTHNFQKGLDMGCGSGILAIAMTKLWPAIHVTAIDIDPEAITVTGRHAQLNDASQSLFLAAGDGYACPLSLANEPYDLIVANILAGPLIAMAGDLAKALAPGGFAILSGLLERQRAEVMAAHEKQGLALVVTEEIGPWQALVLQKKL
jgi:ribosomal protein L11 methyltransferase